MLVEREWGQHARMPTSGLDDAALLRTLAAHDFNKTAAARALGIPRSTLRDRLSKLDAACAGDSDADAPGGDGADDSGAPGPAQARACADSPDP